MSITFISKNLTEITGVAQFFQGILICTLLLIDAARLVSITRTLNIFTSDAEQHLCLNQVQEVLLLLVVTSLVLTDTLFKK